MNKYQLKSEKGTMQTMTIDVFKAFIYPLQEKYFVWFFTGYPERYRLVQPCAILFIRFAEFSARPQTS